MDAGVNHIDTAQFYGPDVANELLREALYPYPDELVIVSKVGAERDDQGQWLAAQRPEQLRAGVETNLASLGLEQIPVVNLRRHPESDVLLTEQVHAMEALRKEGLIGGIGLSNVELEQYRTAQSLIDIACVQNRYNLADTSGQDVFEACRADGVPFVPFFPLGSAFNPETRYSVLHPSRLRLIDSAQRRLKLLSPGCSNVPRASAHPGDFVGCALGGESGRR